MKISNYLIKLSGDHILYRNDQSIYDQNEKRKLINNNNIISNNQIIKTNNNQAHSLNNHNSNMQLSTKAKSNKNNNDELSYREIHANKLIRQINDIYYQNQGNEKLKINNNIYKLNLLNINMGKIIVKNAVKRKPGYLYYVDGQGSVCEAKMSRGGKKSAKKK